MSHTTVVEREHLAVAATPARTVSRWIAATPAVYALAYPWLVMALASRVDAFRAGDGSFASAGALAVAFTVAFVALAPLISLTVAHRLGSQPVQTVGGLRARRVAHLACAAPSLLVAFGNFSRLLDARSLVTPAWMMLWVSLAAYVLATANDETVASQTVTRVRLRTAHALSAAGILAIFLVPHLTNHASSLLSGATHLRVMDSVRQVYRAPVVEPLLIGLIGWQVISGLTMFLSRVRRLSVNLFDTLQTVSGIYLAVFLMSHLTAVFSARTAGVDTNWVWLVGKAGHLFAGSAMTVMPHYFIGPIFVFVHVACGVRNVRLARGTASRAADRLALAIITVGVLVSVTITAALLGAHVAS